jgi:hypothetical protein
LLRFTVDAAARSVASVLAAAGQVHEPKDSKVHAADTSSAAAAAAAAVPQVLEPKDGKVVYKDWDHMGSEIGQLETFDDDEQPLPQNVSACAALYLTFGCQLAVGVLACLSGLVGHFAGDSLGLRDSLQQIVLAWGS